MKISKLGRNERCPCGSGRKHKRCCNGWLVDDKGRVLPPDLATDPHPRFREAVIEHAFDVGCDEWWDIDTTRQDVWDEVEEHGLEISLVAEVGIKGPMLLWYERTKRMIPAHVWFHWKRTGELCVRRLPEPENLLLFDKTFDEILDTFASRARQADGTAYQLVITRGIVTIDSTGTSEILDEDKLRSSLGSGGYGVAGLVARNVESHSSLWPDEMAIPTAVGATFLSQLGPGISRVQPSFPSPGAGSCGASDMTEDP